MFFRTPLIVLALVLISGCNDSRHPLEVPSGLENQLSEFHEKYKRGDVIHVVEIEILGKVLEVGVVETVHGAEYGFAKKPSEISRLGLIKQGSFSVYDYGAEFLFVIVDPALSMDIRSGRIDDGDVAK